MFGPCSGFGRPFQHPEPAIGEAYVLSAKPSRGERTSVTAAPWSSTEYIVVDQCEKQNVSWEEMDQHSIQMRTGLQTWTNISEANAELMTSSSARCTKLPVPGGAVCMDFTPRPVGSPRSFRWNGLWGSPRHPREVPVHGIPG